MIRPWIFEFANLPSQAGENGYDWYLDLWVRAERDGFEGVFFSEHHFNPGTPLPSPNLLIAALAMRTTTLRMGVMGQVLPLNAPWRVAEELGMLDQLSGGRLEVGYSSGSGPMETVKVGIPQEEVRPRYREALDIVEQALRQPEISYHGQYFSFDGLTIAPRTVQQPPPRWITALSEESARDAALRGCKLSTGFIDCNKVIAVFDAYRAAAPGAGPDSLGLRRQIFIAATDAEAKEQSDAANAIQRARMDARSAVQATAVGSDAPDAPQSKDRSSRYFGADETIVGSSASVTEQIIDQCRRTGAGHILAYNSAALSRAQLTASYRLWADIIPTLRKAEVGGAKTTEPAR